MTEEPPFDDGVPALRCMRCRKRASKVTCDARYGGKGICPTCVNKLNKQDPTGISRGLISFPK